MTSRIGSKGQVVIPKGLRDRLSLHPGDEVELVQRGDAIVLTARRRSPDLGGRFARSGMAARLLEDRADEAR
jgi:AbrB family looped-hinge helix DNA binding protein